MAQLSSPSDAEHSLIRNRSRIWTFLVCVSLSAVVVTPFFFMGRTDHPESASLLRMPITHDMPVHLEQMRFFYEGLAAGKLYPRWEEATNRGFGAPTTNFYPPVIYYLTSAFYSLTHDWLIALLALHVAMMAASGAAIYAYAREHLSQPASTAVMIAYTVFPYHLIDQYQRGAMAELLGFIWAPLILLFTDRILKSKGGSRPIGSIAGLAAGYGAFLWSHPPTAYQFTIMLGLYVLVSSLLRKDFAGLALVAAAAGLGLALSAAYTYPAAIEQSLVHLQYVSDNWPYHESYVFANTEYARQHSGFFRLIDHTWIFNCAAALLCGAVILAFNRAGIGDKQRIRQSVIPWLVVGALASFLMTSKSEPIGSLIPKIEVGVFSWRMLAITTLVGALLTGAIIEQARLSRRGLAAVSIGVFVAALVFDIARVAAPMVQAPIVTRMPEPLDHALIPLTAPENPEELPQIERAGLTKGNGIADPVVWQPEHRVIQVDLFEPDQLWIRTYYFPGWRASIDGSPAGIEIGNTWGNITVEVPAGAHTVTLDFGATPIRRKAEMISLVALAVLIVIFTMGRLKRPAKNVIRKP